MSVPSKHNGWVVKETTDSGNVYEFIGTANALVADLPTEDVGTGSLAVSQDGKRYVFHEDVGWRQITIGGGGITPTGTLELSITQNGTTIADVSSYADAEIDVDVPNTYTGGDEGKVVENGELVSQSSQLVLSNGTYDTTKKNQVQVSVSNTYTAEDQGKVVQGQRQLVAQTSTTKTANGTYDTTLNNEVVVSVPNTYEQSDEGKVVHNGALASQSALMAVSNGTYDTTLNNEVVVAVPQPSGTKNIDADGTYDVSAFATASVMDKFLRGLLANSSNVQIEDEYVIPSDLTEIGLGENHQYYVDVGALANLKAKKVSAPSVTLMRGKMFANSKALEEANFPECTRFDNNAFQDAKALKTVNFPKLRTMDRGWAFSGNSALTTLELPLLTTIGSEGFCVWNSAMTTLKVPKLPLLKQAGYSGQRAIKNCTALTLLVVASLTEINGNDMITGCSSLVNLSLPACLSIATPFTGDTSLANLFLPGSSLCALTNGSALADTLIASGQGTIWVNDSLVSQYQAATNWLTYASAIRPISEYAGQFNYNEGVE